MASTETVDDLPARASLPRLAGPAWWQTARLRADPVGVLARTRRRLGEVFAVDLLPAGRLVVVADPTAARMVLAGSTSAGAANAATLPFVLAPRSVFCTNGTANQRRRALLHPPLCPSAAGRWSDALIDAVARAVGSWPVGRPLVLLPRMRRIVAAAWTPVLVDVSEPVRRTALAAAAYSTMSAGSAVGPALLASHAATRPLAARLVARRQQWLAALLEAEVGSRRGTSSPHADDVLGVLLAARDQDPAIDQETISAEVTSLVAALVEVQATALAWGVERLIRHPSVADRLRTAPEDEPYADAVACEVLRTRPPVVGAFRRLDTPIRVCGSTLPAGVLAMAALQLVHHHPGHYAEPWAFRPDRFRSGPTVAWMPFGAGRRECLGTHLARLTLRTVLPALVRRVRLRPLLAAPEKARLVGTLLMPGRLTAVVRER